jgi:hypothetical protein
LRQCLGKVNTPLLFPSHGRSASIPVSPCVSRIKSLFTPVGTVLEKGIAVTTVSREHEKVNGREMTGFAVKTSERGIDPRGGNNNHAAVVKRMNVNVNAGKKSTDGHRGSWERENPVGCLSGCRQQSTGGGGMSNVLKKVLFASVASGLWAIASAAFAAGDVAVIVNPGLGISSLARNEVSRIYLGKKKTVAGESVKIAVLKGDVHGAFLDAYVGRTPSQFASYYKKIIFTGKGRAPASMADDQAMLDFVAGTPGAMGYVNADRVNSSVKVVEVK